MIPVAPVLKTVMNWAEIWKTEVTCTAQLSRVPVSYDDRSFVPMNHRHLTRLFSIVKIWASGHARLATYASYLHDASTNEKQTNCTNELN